jgi:tetratricopeptide (TPR) repeat protein/tRNA A-37 threonylcarbamoyl transferase component Bud32
VPDAPSLPTLPTLLVDLDGNDRPQVRRGEGGPATLPGDIPGYEVLANLGHGAMGVVFKARQVALNRLVAIKMIGSRLVRPEWRSRFLAEAAALARLDHPNIVHVFDSGEYHGLPFFTMELVSGGNLDQKVNNTPLPPAPAASLVRTLALAMQAAHDAGIVHRDLKPANILLAPTVRAGIGQSAGPTVDLGTPKITDFGLARFLNDSAGNTHDGALMGTPSYMAPEQADGAIALIGPRTDIYSLGAILYELLTGRPPFKGETVRATLEQVRRHDPVPPRQLRPTCPRDLETICLKCLEKEPNRRYGSAAELAADLDRYLRGEPTLARPAGPAERLIKWARRWPSQAALVAVLLLAALAGIVAVPYHIRQLEAERADARNQQHRAEVLANSQHLLRLAEQAVATGSRPREWSLAENYCRQVLESVGASDLVGDPELIALGSEATKLAREARQQIDAADGRAKEKAERRQVATDLQQFRDLRDEAFFLSYRDIVVGVEAPAAEVEVKARGALRPFGGPDARRLATALTRYQGAELHEVQSGFCEVLLLLAEARARAGQPREALDILQQAESLGSAQYTIQRRRSRYLAGLRADDRPTGDKSPDTLSPCHLVALSFVANALQTHPLSAVGACGQLLIAPSLPVPTTGLDWFLAGRDHLLHDQAPSSAIHELTHALQEEPGMFWAHFLRARAWLRVGNFAAAEMDLKACQERRPNFVWSYLLCGYVLVHEGLWTAAEAELDEAARLLHQSPDRAAEYALSINRGVLALGRGNPVAARAAFEAAVALDASRYHAYLDLAEACTRASEPKQALAWLCQGIEHNPRQPELLRARAELLHAAGENDKALADILAAIDYRTGGDAAERRAADHLEEARILFDLQRYPEALAAGRAANDLHGSPATDRLLGLTLWKLHHFAEALAALDHYGLAETGVDPEVVQARAQCRIGLGQLDALVDEYSQALARGPRADWYAARGWARVANGAVRLAREDFEAALARCRSYPDARIGLGLVKAIQGDHAGGVEDTEAALALEKRKQALSPQLLYKAVRAFSQAAEAVERSPSPPLLRERVALRDLYLRRALGLLRDALRGLPPAERVALWESDVLVDDALAPLRREPGFRDLAPPRGP